MAQETKTPDVGTVHGSVIGHLRHQVDEIGVTNVELGRQARRLLGDGGLSAYVESAAVKVEPDPLSEHPETVGVFAIARIRFATGVGNGWTQGGEIRTPGLWDVEQPSVDYLRDIGGEELNELSDMLAALGLRLPDEVNWSEVDNAR